MPAFAVTPSRAASRAASVDYATSDGSAQAGEDYTAKSGAEVRGRRVGEEGRGGGARRRARRGRGDADAVESVGRAGGRRGAGHDRERGPDAGGAAGQLRPGDGRAGGDPRRGAGGGDLSAAFPGAAGGPGVAAGQRAGPQFAQPMGDGRGGWRSDGRRRHGRGFNGDGLGRGAPRPAGSRKAAGSCRRARRSTRRSRTRPATMLRGARACVEALPAFLGVGSPAVAAGSAVLGRCLRGAGTRPDDSRETAAVRADRGVAGSGRRGRARDGGGGSQG